MSVFNEEELQTPAPPPPAAASPEATSEVEMEDSQLKTRIKEIANIQKPRLEKNIEGFYWPTERWFIERVLFTMYGGINVMLLFFFFVTHSTFFLLIPMVMGVAQAVFAITGFSILVRVLMMFGLKQNRLE